LLDFKHKIDRFDIFERFKSPIRTHNSTFHRRSTDPNRQREIPSMLNSNPAPRLIPNKHRRLFQNALQRLPKTAQKTPQISQIGVGLLYRVSKVDNAL
jgi:hypothetical protein